MVPLEQGTKSQFLADVLQGLSRPQKSIPPKYLYDERGSELFEKICELPEYYVTRTETGILKESISELEMLLSQGEAAVLVEFGSGSGEKTKLLLRALGQISAYVPVDISQSALDRFTVELKREFPHLAVRPVCADFMDPASILAKTEIPAGRRLVFFPGSTLGNQDPDEAAKFLEQVNRWMGADGKLILGVDLMKNVSVLEKAYNDPSAVTAQFNLNLLKRINRELDGDFEIRNFAHVALFSKEKNRIEMHLRSLRDQTVTISGKQFHFKSGEMIHTESSYKYSIDRLFRLSARAGLRLEKIWQDPKAWFGVFLLGRLPSYQMNDRHSDLHVATTGSVAKNSIRGAA